VGILYSIGERSGVAMGCAGCAMHKGPAVRGAPSIGAPRLRGPLAGSGSGISFLLSDSECSQTNSNLWFSTHNNCFSVKSQLKI
jgi:hypothetical protein